MSVKNKRLSIAILVLVILLVILLYRGCSRNQGPNESVTKEEVINIDTIEIEEATEPIDVEPIAEESITADEPTAAVSQSDSKSKKRNSSPWLIKNDVRKVKNIAIEDIAEDIVVKPIVADETLGHIWGVSGSSNDFIVGDGYHETFYHIKDGRLVEKLYAKGKGTKEYRVQLLSFTYLSSDGLLYGYDQNGGKIMCFKTLPFEFVWNCYVKLFAEDNWTGGMIAVDRDHLLLTLARHKNWAEHITGEYVDDNCAVYEFDGQSIKKMFDVDECWNNSFTRSGSDVLISALKGKTVLYRFANGKKTKVATIDYGDLEMSKDKVFQEGLSVLSKDHATGCNFVQMTDSVMAYWIIPQLDDKRIRYLTIATRDKVQNYRVCIGGLITKVYPDMVDNGVYTMLFQDDLESIIKADEEPSPVGKRIIEAMKGNNGNPVILQFRLKI
ncbi:MAG: hypothetical protein J6W13_04095 [Salinivirgaceae bacterium]|nr:hypothetical protein [Salinivirgaceae bacterium]